MSTNSTQYTTVAKILHWLIGLAVLVQISIGWWMIGLPKGVGTVRVDAFNLHKSIGMTLGLFIIFRVVWRLLHKAPPLPDSVPAWQATAAKISHFLLYACMLVMPVTGFLGSMFTKFPIKYFGYTIYRASGEWPAAKELMSQIHYGCVILFMLLIAMHIAASLKHAFVLRDGVFQRMWFGKGT